VNPAFQHRSLTVVFLVVITLLQSGCASFATLTPAREVKTTHIFYGTDRALAELQTPGIDYGVERGKVSYGTVDLAVWQSSYENELPDVEVRPIISEPTETEFNSAAGMTRDEFFQALNDSAYPGKPGEVLLFVHGFKRDFRTAAENTARLAASIGFKGRTVFWSWPSLDNPGAYLTDRTSLQWSQKHLAQFIIDLVEKGNTRRLVLVAHSLGTQGLTQALVEEIGAAQLATWNIIENLVLLAPDIDLGIFERDIVPGIDAAGIPTTVYASATDWALITSSSLNGYPRAGDSSRGVHSFDGIDTIDATLVRKSFLGHSYYRRSYAVVDDLRLLIVIRQPITLRPGLIRIEEAGRIYWKME